MVCLMNQGIFGTIIALILCSDKMNLKKKENIILLVAGIMTFSVAFCDYISIYCIL